MHIIRVGHLRRWPVGLLAAILIVTVTLAAAPTPAYGQDPPPASFRLEGFTHIYQTWNNCGPANLTMALSHFGWNYDQAVAASWLKPDMEDKNVSPGQMSLYVNQQTNMPNLRALWRYGGNLDLIKRALVAGFPVVIESGFDVEDLGWMGHYETIVAYDDPSQTVWIYDSYLGLGEGYGVTHSYTEFDYWWRHFNRAVIIIFPLEREADLRAVLGNYADPTWATETALQTALNEAAANPADAWAWFNAGTSSAKLGHYNDAAIYFDEAARLGWPYRLTWYQFGPYEAYYNVGRYQDVLTLADDTAATTLYVEETNYWRGMAYAALGRPQDAIFQFDEALRFNRNFEEAQTAKTLVETGAFVPPVPAQ